MVGASNDMADPHVDVVDDDAEMIRRLAIGTKEHEIFDRRRVDGYFTVHGVRVGNLAFRNPETDCSFILVRIAGAQQLVGRLPVEVQTLRLEVRPLVPLEPEPCHGVENTLRHVLAGTFSIGIFDAKNESAAMFPREQPIK